MKIALITDSVADIPAPLIEKFNIQVIPSILIIDGKEYQDGIDLSREAFYDLLPKTASPPTTAAPPPAFFSNIYEQMLSQGYDHILSIHTAPQLSNIHNAAQLAATEYGEKVTVVNSASLSMGVGLQVLAAAKAIGQGADIPTIVQSIQQQRKRMKLFAMVDKLDQLKRSGRVSWLTASMGNFFRMRLFVELKDGDVLRHSQVRTRSKALLALGDLIKAQGQLENLALLHANAPEDAQQVLDSLNLAFVDPPHIVNVTPAIGTHVGAKALGFVAIRTE